MSDNLFPSKEAIDYMILMASQHIYGYFIPRDYLHFLKVFKVVFFSLIEYDQFSNTSIWPIDGNFSSKSGYASNGNKVVLYTPKIFRTEALLSDAVYCLTQDPTFFLKWFTNITNQVCVTERIKVFFYQWKGKKEKITSGIS